MEYSKIEYLLPDEIEKRSFEIIGEELLKRDICIPKEEGPIIKRVIPAQTLIMPKHSAFLRARLQS